MVFQSQGEFEVHMADLIAKVDRLCDERSRDQALAGAKRSLTLFAHRFKRGEKIGPRDRLLLTSALEAARRAVQDPVLEERMFDIEDFVDLHLMKEGP